MEKELKVYENLLLQYEGLSDLEKNAILIYKSKLFVVINSISRVPYYQKLTSSQLSELLFNREACLEIFDNYSKILSDLRNSFIRNTVFKNIRFDNFTDFIEDLKEVLEILNNILFKIVLEDDLVVYRSIMVSNNRDIDFVDDSPLLISTSIKADDAEKFLDANNSMDKHFYNIKLSKGLPVIVSPFSIIRKYYSMIDYYLPDSEYVLAVSNRGNNGQQEITLFRNSISCEEKNVRVIQDDELGEFFIHDIEISLKEDIYFEDQKMVK